MTHVGHTYSMLQGGGTNTFEFDLADTVVMCLIRKKKKRKDYTFRHEFNEKPSTISGCPDISDKMSLLLQPSIQLQMCMMAM